MSIGLQRSERYDRFMPITVFNSTKENLSTFPRLTITIQPEIIEGNITGLPERMSILREGKSRALTIGVEFQVNADDERIPHQEQIISKQ